MYTLLSGLYRYIVQKDEYFVLILGLDEAGKTTLLEQTKTIFTKDYRGMSLSKITTTVGLNLGKIDVGSTRLSFWDLGKSCCFEICMSRGWARAKGRKWEEEREENSFVGG